MTQRVMSLADSLRDPRVALAQGLIEQGMSTAPVGHWTQGLARLAQTLAGVYGQKNIRGEQQAVAEALAGMGGGGAPIGQDDNARLLAEMQADNEAVTGVPATPGETAGYAQGLGMGAPMGGGQPTTPMASALQRLQALPPSPYRDQAMLQEQERERQALAAQEAARAEQDLWMSRFGIQQGAKKEETAAERAWREQQDKNKFGQQLTLEQVKAGLKQPIPGRDVPYSPEVAAQRIDERKAGSPQWGIIQDPQTGQRFMQSTRGELKAMPKPPAEPVSKGQEAVDREFGKEYATFIAGGGYADVAKGLDQIRGVVDRLKSGQENLTGPMLGRAPDAIRSITHPEAVDVQNTIEELVQRNLRVVLGAQFTEKEGERLIARAYNPVLDEQTNAKRVERLMKAMQQAAEAKKKAAEYFEQNGTLKGFKGTADFSINDFNKAIEDSSLDKKEQVGRFTIEVE